jgi:flagellin-like protein
VSRRAQSTIIGVAVLLAVTVVSLTTLTVVVGSVVEESADAAAERRVAASLDDALDPQRSGRHERRVALHGGRLRVVDRSVRLLDGDAVVSTRSVGGLVYAVGPRRVRAVAGATVRAAGGGARLHGAPPVAARNQTLFVGLPVLDASPVAVAGDATVSLRTNVSHERRHLDGGVDGLAVETRTPGVWERRFESLGARTTRRSFDDDGVPSVVAHFPDVREAYVFVHELRLEVGR